MLSQKPANLFRPEDFDYDPKANICICPAVHNIKFRSERVNEPGHDKINFEGYRKQCKDCELKQQYMKNPESADHVNGNGRQVFFIKGKAKRKPSNTDWMKERVDSPEAKFIYSHRMSVVDPVFGNLERNKGLDRFSLRGKKKVQSQWQLYCIIHNIEKLKNYGKLAA